MYFVMPTAITIGCAKTSQDMIEFQDHGEHIYTLDGAFDERLIDDIIEGFDKSESQGLTLQRNQYTGNEYPTMKDTSVFMSMSDCAGVQGLEQMVDIINQDIMNEWCRMYPVLSSGNYRDIYVAQAKMQKTYPGGGYHNWHTEHCNQINSHNALLAWMVYLNDVDDGGETEFLYQQKRISPKRNRFVVWPAGFTHLHRGNPPLKEVKYVTTGWIHWI